MDISVAEKLEELIETKFSQLKVQMIKYEESNTLEDWHEAIEILPEIADLVCCLKIEALKLEGKHPIN